MSKARILSKNAFAAGTVSSVQVSGGTTGLTFAGGPVTTTGTLTMSGTLAVTSGGTGTSSSTGTGNNVLSANPTFTGTVTTSAITATGALTLSGAVAPIILNASAGVAGQILTSAGPGATPTWATPSQGSVTSVQASGGTTGLTFSGGPVTSSGTLTLGGTLAVASGGTGTSSSTGTGSVVLSGSPTFTGTVASSELTITGTATLSGTTSRLSLNGSTGTAGQVLLSGGTGDAPTWGAAVMTTGNQTVAGAKTFSSLTRIVANTSAGVNYSNGQLTLESSDLTPASLGFHRSGATACQLRHDSNGLILSGTSQTAAADFYAYGNVTAYSDIRLKRNVEPIAGALEKVLRIGGYTFEKINDENENVGRRHTGVIAQEILAVIPEAVSERDGYYAVSYGNLVGLLIEAIKEQNAQINELTAQVNNLKAGS